MPKTNRHPIPDDVLVIAVNETLQKFPGKCADGWGEYEKSYCRKVCGDRYQFVETDWIGHRAIDLRKAGKCVSVNGGAKRKAIEVPSGEYADYLGGQHWCAFRLEVLDFWGHKCCLCASKATEVHHNTYIRRGDEHLTDCVAICRQCHKQVHGRMPSGNEAFGGADCNELF